MRITGKTATNVTVLNIGPGFFTTMQIPLLLGREVDGRDITATRHVAVVNELFVKTYMDNQNAIGQHFTLGAKEAVDFEIISVSKTPRLHSLNHDTPPVPSVP